jgi:phosphate transport system substrate-binding protein
MIMTKFFSAVAAVAVLAGATVAHADISGAGATFPAPVYSAWAADYKAKAGVAVNYQAIGSGGGIAQIKAKTVDFGATDKPLPGADLTNLGLFQFPTVIGSILPVVNLPGVKPGQLKLSSAVLADIFLGKITRWNDPAIAGLNKGVALPGLPITVVHRSDGSGTTFVFTSYLSLKSAEWKSKVGANSDVKWPAGQGGKGNDGVAALVKQTPGSIGYVEYVFAHSNHLTDAQLQNHDGKFLAASAAATAAAASHADWANAPGFAATMLDQPGATSWPITSATFILVYRNSDKPAQVGEVLKFFDWAYKNGDAAAAKLDYIALPLSVKNAVRKAWAAQVKTK